MENRNWQLIDTIVEIKSPWVTLIGERIKDDQDNILDYWRVEKEDSVIVVTRYN